MKKIYIFFIVLIASIGISNAQKTDLNGIWKLTETIQYDELTKTYTYFITFNDTGVVEISGRDMGITWKKNDAENMLTIEGSMLEGIEGENKIETLDDTELKLKNSEGKITSLQKIAPQTNKFVGEWLLEKIVEDGKTNIAGELIDLNSNGILYVQGYMFGDWDYNNTTKKLIFEVTEKKDPFNGEHTILESNKSTFILDVKGAKMYFSKMDREKIAKGNSESGLIGTWKIESKKSQDGKIFITFKTPDELVYVVKTDYSQQKGGAMWIFNKEDFTLFIKGFYDVNLPEGESTIIKLEDNNLELEHNGTIYSLKREKKQNIERLNFTQDDFFTEEGDYKYEREEQKLPWLMWSEMKTDLLYVNQLVYKYSTLINHTESFEDTTLTANVNATLEEEGFNIDYIFNGYDSYNLPEDTAFPSNPEYSNPLYPLNDTMYRVVGNEQITTSAGIFDCTVLEIFGDREVRKKVWMINNKIGVYAKIIADNPDEHFGSYHIYELQEIIKSH